MYADDSSDTQVVDVMSLTDIPAEPQPLEDVSAAKQRENFQGGLPTAKLAPPEEDHYTPSEEAWHQGCYSHVLTSSAYVMFLCPLL